MVGEMVLMEYELYCYSAVEKRALTDLAKIWFRTDPGFLQLKGFGYQFNLPLGIHGMAEQQNQKTFCAIS